MFECGNLDIKGFEIFKNLKSTEVFRVHFLAGLPKKGRALNTGELFTSARSLKWRQDAIFLRVGVVPS